MHWFLLVVAGLLEVVWAAALKRVNEPLFLVVFLAALGGSMAGLAYAVQKIPLSTAYAVWVGIGVVGTAAVGIGIYGERPTPAQLVFLGLVAVGIVGTKLTSPG